MKIEKNGKTYIVKENKMSWTVAAEEGIISVSYNVPKGECPTFETLRNYVSESDLF